MQQIHWPLGLNEGGQMELCLGENKDFVSNTPNDRVLVTRKYRSSTDLGTGYRQNGRETSLLPWYRYLERSVRCNLKSQPMQVRHGRA